MTDLIYGWKNAEEGQEEVLEEGDLGNGTVCAKYLDQMNREEYYNSLRFAVGYRELQAMWSTRESDKGQMESDDFPNIRQETDDFPNSSNSGLMLFDAAQRKQCMNLPLRDCISGSPSLSATHLQVPSFRSPTRWASSASASPLGTPSPMTSEAPSPIASSPNASVTSSPRLGGSHRSHLSSTLTHGSNITPGRYASEESLHESQQKIPNCDKKQRSRLLETIRRIIGHFRGGRSQSPPRLPTEYQIAEMETELESYRQLSESKRRAADLLKHQLMEVLYEKVVSEVEERHRRRHLEQEMMGLEFELHLLRSTTEDSIRTLTRQLERVITEKKSLQRQVNYRTTDDNIPEFNHQVSCKKNNDAFAVEAPLRRSSH